MQWVRCIIDVTFRDLISRPVGRIVALLATALRPATKPERHNVMAIDLNSLSTEQLRELTKGLMAKLEEASKPRALTMKVSEKGALSVYGMGKFPVTLYRSQWERLFAAKQQFVDFIKANEHLLKAKGD
jgi:hypothetical protein